MLFEYPLISNYIILYCIISIAFVAVPEKFKCLQDKTVIYYQPLTSQCIFYTELGFWTFYFQRPNTNLCVTSMHLKF